MSRNIEMRASVLSVLFGPTDDGYTVISVTDEKGERVVVDGKALPASIEPGDEIIVEGQWRDSNQGIKLRATSARKTMPQSEKGMITWLTKAKIPGVGVKRAEKLVAAFGLDTVNKIIDLDPEAVKIIGKAKAPGASENIANRRAEAELGAMLSAHGINMGVQQRILKKFGDKTQKMVSEKPYELIVSINGVAFTTADKIAESSGIAKDDPSRIRAGILEVMRVATNDGHCALYHQQVIDGAYKLLYVDRDLIEQEITNIPAKHIKAVTINGMRGWALTRINETEKRLAANIIGKIFDRDIPEVPEDVARECVMKAQDQLGVTLNKEQTAAAMMAIRNKISILVGGPGTGKTHTLKIVIRAYMLLARGWPKLARNKKVSPAAPTGKAAKRITEMTLIESKTIHRLLEYRPEENAFERNESNPIDAGLVIIDESSMPDVFISDDLAKAWAGVRILLVGDIDQLPSVGPGKVLADMLSSEIVPHVRLEQIYRQAEGSEIALGAAAIRKGQMPDMGNPGQSDLVFIEIENTNQIADRIVDMYVNKMPRHLAKIGIDPTSIQVLSPGKQSEVGVIALNQRIQSRLHEGSSKGAVAFLSDKLEGRVGDRVIQLENDYERSIFNGDTGKIVEIDVDDKGTAKEVHVDFDGEIITFPGPTVHNLSLAYALTIHKSQGSEFQVVIIPVTNAHYTLMKRQLIYTGETRAKRICVFIGSKRAFRQALTREDTVSRTTLLAGYLREAYEKKIN